MPVIVVVTKADVPGTADAIIHDYHEVNIGETIMAISAPHRIGIDELTETIENELVKLHFGKTIGDEESGIGNQEIGTEHEPSAIPRIAIVGRPNVGKSSIVNALMSDAQRQTAPILVSPIAGTTRDSIDTEVRYHDKPYVLVDTAGLRKRSRANVDELERYSVFRTRNTAKGS